MTFGTCEMMTGPVICSAEILVFIQRLAFTVTGLFSVVIHDETYTEMYMINVYSI